MPLQRFFLFLILAGCGAAIYGCGAMDNVRVTNAIMARGEEARKNSMKVEASTEIRLQNGLVFTLSPGWIYRTDRVKSTSFSQPVNLALRLPPGNTSAFPADLAVWEKTSQSHQKSLVNLTKADEKKFLDDYAAGVNAFASSKGWVVISGEYELETVNGLLCVFGTTIFRSAAKADAAPRVERRVDILHEDRSILFLVSYFQQNETPALVQDISNVLHSVRLIQGQQ